MNFLHIMQSVSPEFGGPIEALVRSEPTWRRLGHRRTIVSLDLADDPWVAACPIPTTGLGSAATRRLRRHLPLLRYGFTARLIPWLRAHHDSYDAIVVHGLWNYTAWAARRVLPTQAKPYFVFTHGMLDPWFRRAHPVKHWAKQLSWWLAEGPLLHGSQGVLFTSGEEMRCAEGAFSPYRFAKAVCGYGTAEPPDASDAMARAFRARVPSLRARRYLLFLGRLHPKKGCDLLIEAFGRLAARDPTLDLVMAGPDQAGWSSTLKAQAEEAGIGSRVHWPGMLTGDAKWGAIRGCEAFALPSHGENFGLAVVEVMACGRPVLLSDRVNIAPVIVGDGGGLSGPDTAEGVTDTLARFLSMDRAGRTTMGQRARAAFLTHFLIDTVAERTLAILTRAAQPAPSQTRLPAAAETPWLAVGKA